MQPTESFYVPKPNLLLFTVDNNQDQPLLSLLFRTPGGRKARIPRRW